LWRRPRALAHHCIMPTTKDFKLEVCCFIFSLSLVPQQFFFVAATLNFTGCDGHVLHGHALPRRECVTWRHLCRFAHTVALCCLAVALYYLLCGTLRCSSRLGCPNQGMSFIPLGCRHLLVLFLLTIFLLFLLQELSKYFHMPEKAVAKELGICLTSLKKLCRSYGITRWPFRKVPNCLRSL